MMGRRFTTRHGGLTLVELLVVLAIVVMISSVSIPLLNNSIHERRQREAARLLNNFIEGAKVRAAQMGRPVGVIFEPESAITPHQEPVTLDACVVVSYVEQPPPYIGDSAASRAIVENWTVTKIFSDGPGVDPATAGTESMGAGLVRVNDLLRFNFVGPLFRITSTAGNEWQFVPAEQPVGNAVNAPPAGGGPIHGVPSPDYPQGAAFQVLRQPFKTAAQPLQMPDGTVVDLDFSGLDGLSPFDVPGAVIVTFTPGGSVAYVYFQPTDGTTYAPLFTRTSAALHFLVGKREFRGGPDQSGLDNCRNLIDLKNFWVTINPVSGRVKTDENGIVSAALYDPTNFTIPDAGSLLAALLEARTYARSPESAR